MLMECRECSTTGCLFVAVVAALVVAVAVAVAFPAVTVTRHESAPPVDADPPKFVDILPDRGCEHVDSLIA